MVHLYSIDITGLIYSIISKYKHITCAHIYYCERSPNETSIHVQSVYCNEYLSSNQQNIYVNYPQVKWNGE